MFDIQAVPFGKFTSYRLINQQSGEYFTVVPEFGANVTEIVLRSKDVLISVIDGYSEDHLLEEHKGYRSSRLLPFPNRVLNGQYTFKGESHRLTINRAKEGHAIHGLYYDKPFKVAECNAGPNETSLVLKLDGNGGIPGYPFTFNAFLKYTLSPGGFKSSIQVENTGTSAMPFGDGWHPYFKLNGDADELFLKVPAAEEMELDGRNIPTGKFRPFTHFKQRERIGEIQLDTGLRLKGPGKVVTELYNSQTDATLGVWQETGKYKYNFLQMYIPEARNTVAIEPMTCAANAFNNGFGLIELKPGERFEARFGVYLT